MSGTRLLALVVAAALATGCSGTTPEQAADTPDRPSASPPSASPPTSPEPSSPFVVVGRPTDPPFDLTAAQARRIIEERPTRWRGRPVSVVPLDEVGPTQVAARVNGVDPVRTHPGAVELTVVGDLRRTHLVER